MNDETVYQLCKQAVAQVTSEVLVRRDCIYALSNYTLTPLEYGSFALS